MRLTRLVSSYAQEDGSLTSKSEPDIGIHCLEYVLITPAKDERLFIEGTIQSVVNQTILPKKWVIVSDGSTDGTDEIVKNFAQHHPWIELVRMSEREDRNFAAKVHCFNAGFRKVMEDDFDIIGNLDADISFEPGYFSFLLDKFSKDEHLGVAGTPFVEEGFNSYDQSYANHEHVSGACQLFRRGCYKEIGGYRPNCEGGIDWIAVTTARMLGWKTRTFNEMTCFHHRKMGHATAEPFQVRFKQGKKDYYLGGHPLWQVFRSVFQMKNRPYVLGGAALMAGYVWAGIVRMRRPVAPELMQFHRREQMLRLKQAIRQILNRP